MSEPLVVRHKCDNPPCCNPAHLEIGTHAENMQDMARRGRAAKPDFRGSKNNRAKLTESDVLRIVAMCDEGIGTRAIADEFGVKYYAIRKILSGQRWSHVTGILPKGRDIAN
ncbi:HNH endonuclease [Mycolicibacterium septicum]|nr:HNH endonuclease [Mycolicibacterium septicum]